MNDDVPLNESVSDLPSDSVQEIETVETPTSAGQQLASTREARGWTVEQVANQLNLAARQIDALEKDNYAALPGMVIVRGFIRAYAKLLQVDPLPILACIVGNTAAPNVLPPARSAMSASFSETQLLSGRTPRKFSTKIAVLVLVLLAVGGLVIFKSGYTGWLPGVSSASSSKTSDEIAHPLSAEGTSSETTGPAAGNEAPVVAESDVAAAQSAEAIVTAGSPVVAAKEHASVMQNAVAPADSKNVLAIQARQDSWIEIKRADNTVLASSLLKSGTSESFEITGPVSMVIGNAAGVSVTLRGTPVDVTGNSSNVARLNLK